MTDKIDWRRTRGSHLLTEKQVAQIPDLLRDLADAVTTMQYRFPNMEDVCVHPIGKDQICGVRRFAHEKYMGDEHRWVGYGMV